MTENSPEHRPPLDAEQVAEYLREHPEFFVEHDELGRGWVWGSGRGVVTVRFETAQTPAGPVRSFADDDPLLHPWRPEPEVEPAAGGRPDNPSPADDVPT